jgi:hypothetical protein
VELGNAQMKEGTPEAAAASFREAIRVAPREAVGYCNLAITQMVPSDRAVDPNQMYLAAYNFVFPHYGWAVAATALFVVVSQLKINVTNAYAGSLAWSNFFSRLTHSFHEEL